MTTLLTRLYKDESTANNVREQLFIAGFPRHTMRIISLRDGDSRNSLSARIQAARVPKRAASSYAENVTEGHVLLVVAATYKPLGARKIGLKILSGTETVESKLKTQDFSVPTIPDHAPSVMKDHPRFLTPSPDPDHVGGRFSDQFGFKLLSASRPRNSATRGGGHIMPFKKLRTGRRANSAMRGGSYISRIFWPMKLVTNNRRGMSVLRGGGHPLSRLLGLPTVSR